MSQEGGDGRRHHIRSWDGPAILRLTGHWEDHDGKRSGQQVGEEGKSYG